MVRALWQRIVEEGGPAGRSKPHWRKLRDQATPIPAGRPISRKPSRLSWRSVPGVPRSWDRAANGDEPSIGQATRTAA